MLKEFKEFALKGNVMDLAIGVIIGGAFGKIVTSLVEDLIMPIFALVTSGMNFEDMAYVSGAVTIKYGNFIQTVVNFLIISFSIFVAVKLINRARKKEEVQVNASPVSQEQPQSVRQPQQTEQELLAEIRDLLKNR